MAQTVIQQYQDGNVGIRRGGTTLVIDQIRLVGTLEEVIDVIRWEFVGYGQSLEDSELERIAWRIMQMLR
jgi:hypothetical protein